MVSPQPHNEPMRRFLAGREGLERIAFTTTDAEAGAEALRANGLAATGPLRFGRPVPLPGGGEAEARFSVFQWPADEAPEGVRIFACQHHTREAVWVPELQNQPNGVSQITRALVATERPAEAAAQLARLIGSAAREAGGFHAVPTAPGRAEIAFAPRAAIARMAGLDASSLPEEGGAGVVLGTPTPRPPAFVTGTAILFETA